MSYCSWLVLHTSPLNYYACKNKNDETDQNYTGKNCYYKNWDYKKLGHVTRVKTVKNNYLTNNLANVLIILRFVN